MNNHLYVSAAVFLLALFTLQDSCEPKNRETILPPGDARRGEMAFSALHCDQCHSTWNIDWKGIELEGDVHVRLTSVDRDADEGELISSIVYPSHQISKRHLLEMTTAEWQSKMHSYADVLTVQQLSDLIAYLKSNPARTGDQPQ